MKPWHNRAQNANGEAFGADVKLTVYNARAKHSSTLFFSDEEAANEAKALFESYGWTVETVSRRELWETTHSPGKFEGTPLFAPYFYDAMLDGMGDTLDSDEHFEDCASNVTEGDAQCDCEGSPEPLVTRFAVTQEDKVLFPDLWDAKYVDVWETSDGFVYAETVSE